MTSKEYQQITRAFQPFLRFLAQTHHNEAWHDARRQLLAQADQQIIALLDKLEGPSGVPATTEAETPEPVEAPLDLST